LAGENQRPNYWEGVKKEQLYSKKKTYGSRERDEEKRQEFLQKIKLKKPEDLVYVDESGIDNRE
jgi:hypothetical protein